MLLYSFDALARTAQNLPAVLRTTNTRVTVDQFTAEDNRMVANDKARFAKVWASTWFGSFLGAHIACFRAAGDCRRAVCR